MSCQGNTKSDLSATGGSLSPLRVTNQNGLGICHIEQLHKMLKAKLPGHPDLSRVQLAIAEKKMRDRELTTKKAVRWKNAQGVGGTYIDAGNSCDAFNHLKSQKICPAEADRFEQLTKQNPDHQEKIIETISEYFDSRPNQFMWDFASASAHEGPIVTKLDESFRACSLSPVRVTQLRNHYLAHVYFVKTQLGSRYAGMKASAENLSHLNLAMEGADYLQGKSYLKHLQSILPAAEIGKDAPTSKALAAQITMAAREMQSKENCVMQNMKSFNNLYYCAPPLGKSAVDVINLNSLGLSLREIVNILDGDRDRDKFFTEAFSCSTQKVLIPPQINCRTEDITQMAKDSRTESEFHTKVDQKIEAKLKKGTPIGISSCTRFFTNPNAKTNQVGSNTFTCGQAGSAGYKKGEGSHAVTIIGSRCQNGVKEYLVQNSWGPGCFYDKSFECTKQGGFWAPVSTVINNIRNINYLE